MHEADKKPDEKSTAAAEPRRPIAVTCRISDYHLGMGTKLPSGEPNRHEDFHDDTVYAELLQALEERYERTVPLTLEWGGDMIDFHAITYQGRHAAVPTLEAALTKLEACITGHPVFWNATRGFLSGQTRRIDITAGNHDFELVWPEVQARVRGRLGIGPRDRRIRFVTEVFDGSVCKTHGDSFDPINSNPPRDEWFTTEKYSGSRRTLLNYPYGSILCASIAQSLKLRRARVGRMKKHGEALTLSLAREWYFTGVATLISLSTVFYHVFLTRQSSVRRKAKIRRILRLVLDTVRNETMLSEITEFARRHPNVTSIQAGHTHLPGVQRFVVDGREVTYWNTGTGMGQIRFRRPEFKSFITPFPKLEAFFRRIAFYWKEKPSTAALILLIHVAVIALPFAVRDLFGWSLDQTVWIVLILSVISLLTRLSFALHVDEEFTEYNFLETRRYADGTTETELLRFCPVEKHFKPHEKEPQA